MQIEEIDVLILGAGMAGLTAARTLAERNVSVVVLEAQDRVGGRILTRKTDGGAIIELGAEFVHGRAPELWALIDEVGAETTERDGSMLREEWYGGLAEDDPQDDSMFVPLEELESFQGEDVAFASWLAESDVAEDDRPALVGYVEGFNAADARRISVKALGMQQKAEDATEGDRSWHLHGGYAQLADHLAGRVKELGGEVRLGWEVSTLRWSEGHVEVETSHGVVRARQCIVTLPLGVLQRVNEPESLHMMPEPKAIVQARRLEMGHVLRFSLEFHSRWWEHSEALAKGQLEAMSFLFTPQRMPPVWWTAHPEPEANSVLTGWAGGPKSKKFAGMSAGELGRRACAELAVVFQVPEDEVRSQLVATYTHDWSGDPHALGAYSYVPAGALDAPFAMTAPEAETLYFAGEHTDVTGHWGTVHAAIRSGLRVAQQILGV